VFRFNHRKVWIDLGRFRLAMSGVAGKRPAYAEPSGANGSHLETTRARQAETLALAGFLWCTHGLRLGGLGSTKQTGCKILEPLVGFIAFVVFVFHFVPFNCSGGFGAVVIGV
jgi:hypothetical protein